MPCSACDWVARNGISPGVRCCVRHRGFFERTPMIDKWLNAQCVSRDWKKYFSEIIIRKKRLLGRMDDTRPILFVGPWVGEFGWEVARWQGGVRKRVRARGEGRRIIVGTDQGHGVFYEFADEVWSLPDTVFDYLRVYGVSRQCDSLAPFGGDQPARTEILRRFAQELRIEGDDIDVIEPCRFAGTDQELQQFETPGFIKNQIDSWLKLRNFDKFICIFPRGRAWLSAKNWDVEHWKKVTKYFIQAGYGVVAMGTPSDSWELGIDSEGYASLIDIDQEIATAMNVEVLRRARLAISSESGGALLSLYCKCPTLIMGHPDRAVRCTSDENFFDTAVRYIPSKTYTFSPDRVIHQAEAMLERIGAR